MTHQFDTLIRALDTLRMEAPASYKSYLPDVKDEVGLTQARATAFIHLLLKVRFGITDFLERHKLITDGSQDGGIDAYFIDTESKKLFFIQSKLRTSSTAFDTKTMDANDLIRMEITRIVKGEELDSRGVAFNSKILAFQKSITQIRDIAKYDFVVIFLGNVFNFSDEQLSESPLVL